METPLSREGGSSSHKGTMWMREGYLKKKSVDLFLHLRIQTQAYKETGSKSLAKEVLSLSSTHHEW